MGLKETAAGELATPEAANLDKLRRQCTGAGSLAQCRAESLAGVVELDETGIPARLCPWARSWFTNRVREAAHVHGAAWAAHSWILRQLQSEFREQLARKAVRP